MPLVSSFCFIWIPMLQVYGHYKYFDSFSAGIIFRHQNLTSIKFWHQNLTSIKFWRLKTVPTLRGLRRWMSWNFNRNKDVLQFNLRCYTFLKSEHFMSLWNIESLFILSYSNFNNLFNWWEIHIIFDWYPLIVAVFYISTLVSIKEHLR